MAKVAYPIGQRTWKPSPDHRHMIEPVRPRTPPRLETPRLLLRGWRGRDLKAHAEMYADPQVMRYIGDGRVFDQDRSWREVAMQIGVIDAEGGFRRQFRW